MRVLIAENDASSRKALQKTVEGFGHECLAARDGLEAWDLYQSTPEIDVIISGWTMPGLDGPELCRRVRKRGSPGHTFFILFSEFENKERPSIGRQAGADDYLAKPLHGERLQASLLAASRLMSPHQPQNGNGKADV